MAVEKIILDIRAQTAKARKDINNLKTTTKGLNKEVNTTASLMKKAAGALAAFASIGLITRAIGDMIKLNIEFEKTLTNVLTLLDATSKAKFGDFLEAGALRTMRQYGLEVTDVNKALFDTISAGIKAKDSIKFLNEAARLAVGGVTDLSTAVDGMTSIMNAYGLSIEEANKVASAFFTAQKFGKTTVQELAQNIGQIAPVAKAAGIGFQEILSALALLTKQGIQTDLATTALRATILALTKTTPASEKAFRSLGIETGIAAIKSNGLAATLLQVAKASEENEDILTQLIPNVRAFVAVAALGEEALIEYDEILKEVNEDTGEASSLTAALELQMGTMAKQVDTTRGAWKEFRIELGRGIKDTFVAQAVMAALRAVLINATETMRGTEEGIGNIGDMFNKISPGVEEFAWQTKQVADAMDEVQKAMTAPEVPDVIPTLIPDIDPIIDFQDDLAAANAQFREDEMEANRKWNDVFLQEERQKQLTKLDITRAAFGIAQGLAGENANLQKILAIAESLISTFLSANLAYASQAAIPIIGPALGAIARQDAITSGLANTAIIAGIAIAGFKEGGFTGSGDMRLRDKDGPITGWTHKNEYVFDEPTTKTLRPLFDDIQNNRIDIHGLAALTRRGTMRTATKLNADILERQVEKIYRKMSEEQPEKASIIYTNQGYVKKIGNTTINVNT